MTSDVYESEYDASDVLICVGIVLMSVGVAALGVAYLFPYDDLAADAVNPLYNTARESEWAALRAWTVFTVSWTAGLGLITISVIIITSAIVYTNCWCPRHPVTSSRDDVMPLSGHAWTRYGSSDNEFPR